MRPFVLLLAIVGVMAATPPSAARRRAPVSPADTHSRSSYNIRPSAARPQDFGCLGADTAADPFARHFLRYVQLTVRDTSVYAVQTRPVARLPYRPTASVALVSDSATCVMLAVLFVQSMPGRDSTEGDSVYAVTVDSTHYVMTDLRGGSSPTVRHNADGSVTIVQRPMVRDAITIDRATGAKTPWLYDLFAYPW